MESNPGLKYSYRVHKCCIKYTYTGKHYTEKSENEERVPCILAHTYSESPHKNQACHGWSGCTVEVTYMYGLYLHIWTRNQTYTVASASNVTGSVFMRRIRLFLGQCRYVIQYFPIM